jgi:hypothetical protein
LGTSHALELQGGGFDHGCLRLNSTDFLTRIRFTRST